MRKFLTFTLLAVFFLNTLHSERIFLLYDFSGSFLRWVDPKIRERSKTFIREFVEISNDTIVLIPIGSNYENTFFKSIAYEPARSKFVGDEDDVKTINERRKSAFLEEYAEKLQDKPAGHTDLFATLFITAKVARPGDLILIISDGKDTRARNIPAKSDVFRGKKVIHLFICDENAMKELQKFYNAHGAENPELYDVYETFQNLNAVKIYELFKFKTKN